MRCAVCRAMSEVVWRFRGWCRELRGGHIGDGIRPSMRRRGYATELIRLALEECRSLVTDGSQVLMVCDKSNVGSAKSIMNNGGVLEDEFDDGGTIKQRYWIAL